MSAVAVDRPSEPSEGYDLGEREEQSSAADPKPQLGSIRKTIVAATALSTQLFVQGHLAGTIFPLYQIGERLNTTVPGELAWMAASYGLTVGACLVPFGRIGDLAGLKRTWMVGFAIMALANLGSGFARTPIQFDVCRGLAGMGVAFALPSAVGILGRTYTSDKHRAVVFSLLGMMAPLGFVIPSLIASWIAIKGHPEWIFFLATISCTVVLGLGTITFPADTASLAGLKQLDWLGSLLLILTLGFFNFAWNQGPLAGWPTALPLTFLVLSFPLGLAFFLYERRLGEKALVPIDLLRKTPLLVYLSLWMGWMSFGIWLYYLSLFLRNVRGVNSPVLVTVQFLPSLPAGILAALSVPLLLRRVPPHRIFLLSCVAFLIGNILMAVAPVSTTYWAVIFPSTIVVIFGPGKCNLSYAAGQFLISTAVKDEHQSIAGAMVAMVVNYSLSIGLGMAGTVEAYTFPSGPLVKGYRAAFYFAIGLAGMAAGVVGLLVKIPKKHEL